MAGPDIEALIRQLSKLPGLGPRSARRAVLDLIKKKESLIQLAYENNVPIFCPAFTDSSAVFGLVLHQVKNPK